MFIVLANDGWTRLYISHYRFASSPIGATFFFFILLIIGQFILLNLFISVLINNFEQLSVKNDLIKKLIELKKESAYIRIKSWFLRNVLCKKSIKEDSEKTLLKGERIIDELIDERHQKELRQRDQDLYQ